MSERTASTRTSKWRPLEIAAGIVNFAAAVVNAIRFRHGHDSVDAVFAVLFLVIAILFLWRSSRPERERETQVTQLNIQDSTERKS